MPTDDSALSEDTVRAGPVAREINAETAGIFVAPEYEYSVGAEGLPVNCDPERAYRRAMRKAGGKHLAVAADAARSAGCKFSGKVVQFRSWCTELQVV